MTLSLTHPTAGPGGTPLVLELPDQLAWENEFTWQRVVQATEYTTTGALVIDAWVKQSGRPITLAGSEKRAWCERGNLLMLRTWAETPGLQLTLTGLRGVSRTVVFDHAGGAIDATDISEDADKADSDPYALTIKFLEL